MFDPLIYLLFAVVAVVFFSGTVPLIMAVKLNDKHRLDRLLDLYTEVFAAGAAAIIGAMKMFRRKDDAEDPKKLPSPQG
jgi:hypothetical protein